MLRIRFKEPAPELHEASDNHARDEIVSLYKFWLLSHANKTISLLRTALSGANDQRVKKQGWRLLILLILEI